MAYRLGLFGFLEIELSPSLPGSFMFGFPHHCSPYVLLALILPSTASTVAGQAAFSDQTTATGLTFLHTLDPVNGDGNIMVAGGAVGDFNRDGWPDVFVLGGGGVADALFINNGMGGFVDQAAAWGVDQFHHGVAAAVGDYNNDGYLDIFVTSYGPTTDVPKPSGHRLYQNQAGSGFLNVAMAAGVNQTSTNIPSGSSASFGDYDLDGDLDLFVCSSMMAGISNILFRNDGDGTFTDVTTAAGVGDPGVMGFAGTLVDMDGDLWPELINIADFHTSKYYINDRDGSFSSVAVQPPKFDQVNGMGSTFGDFNNDLKMDFYASGIYPTPGNILLMNQGNHDYIEDGVNAGVDDGGWGWGVAAMDCDNDGWLDIAATNGWNFGHNNEATRFFLSQRDGTFTETATTSGLVHLYQGRTVLRLDYDRDGDLDLIILSNQGPLVLFRNDAGQAVGNYLQVQLDTSKNPGLAPDGLGTKLYFRMGSTWRMRHMDSGPSYLGTHEFLIHLGLMDQTKVDEIRVEWNDGSYTYLANTAANQRLVISAGTPLQGDELMRGLSASFSASKLPADQPVLFLYSLGGPGVGTQNFLGGLDLDILDPIRMAGYATSNALGNAQITVSVPLNAPLQEIGIQAIVLDGPFGLQSSKTNAISRLVMP
jgi:enediyne biosynthesis protein E4